MWTASICSFSLSPRIIEPEALKQGNMSSLGFTSKEQRNLGLLVHLMTTNPKILYSPIGSQVDKVIQKASIEQCCGQSAWHIGLEEDSA